MSATWTPLPDKENPSSVFRSTSKVLASAVKSSNNGAIRKKKVFGDVKNTIENVNRDFGELTLKAPEKGHDVKQEIEDDNWPEPESLPALQSVEDDYEDCLLPGLRFTQSELEELPNFWKNFQKPLVNSIPDSPVHFPIREFTLDIKLELLADEIIDIPPPLWD